ncbi:MAG TPA: DMT family transporter [Thermopetrobacter sp.]|nr:DMT family transporter [Thermopetrobacter sp.]
MTSSSHHTPLSGMILVVLAFGLLAGLDSMSKYMTAFLPVIAIVLWRYVTGTLFALVFGYAKRRAALWRTAHPWLQLLRGLLMTVSTLFVVLALRRLPLVTTSAILFSAPLWVAALSHLLLGEKVGPARWAAVVAGFLGVLIVLRPGTPDFQPAMLFALAAALSFALYQLLTRRVGGHDDAVSSLFLSSAGAALLSLPLAAFIPVWPQENWQWWPLIAMGALGTLAHLLLIEAYRRADAAQLAPFIYTQIVWMIVIGWLVFGDVPDVMTLSGAALVIAAGVFIAARERARQRRAAAGR